MNKLMTGAAILPLLAWSAVAQEPQQLDAAKKQKLEIDQQLVKMQAIGAVKGFGYHAWSAASGAR